MSGSPDKTSSVGPMRVSSKEIEAAMKRGVRDALRRHKLLGESIAVSRDGKVVIVPAEEIVVPELPEDDA